MRKPELEAHTKACKLVFKLGLIAKQLFVNHISVNMNVKLSIS